MTDFDARMAMLRARFASRAVADEIALRSALDRGDRFEVQRLAHSLSGAGSIFGYPAITEAAEAVERAVFRKVEEEELHQVGSLLCERLRAATPPDEPGAAAPEQRSQ